MNSSGHSDSNTVCLARNASASAQPASNCRRRNAGGAPPKARTTRSGRSARRTWERSSLVLLVCLHAMITPRHNRTKQQPQNHTSKKQSRNTINILAIQGPSWTASGRFSCRRYSNFRVFILDHHGSTLGVILTSFWS